MKGVKFNNYHSWSDFSLILNSKEIDAPAPKLTTVDIPGADGDLDFSEYFGEIKYKNRKLIFNFSSIVPYEEFLTLYSYTQSIIHGQKMKITLDDDPNFYYFGRITLDKWVTKGKVGSIVATCDCDPYKYKTNKTVRAFTIAESETTYENVLVNARMTVSPKITVTGGTVELVVNLTTYTLSPGVYNISDLVLREGTTAITYSGTAGASISFEYQEGVL